MSNNCNKKKLDVLLLIPPVNSNSLLDIKWENHFEFLGVEYILTTLRNNNYNTAILDGENLELSIEDIVKIILDISPDILGVTVSKSQFINAKIIVNMLRERGYDSIVIFGGYFPTLSTEKLLNSIEGKNIAIIGEGEFTFLKLVKKIKRKESYESLPGIAYRTTDKTVINEAKCLCNNLDEIDFPTRDTLKYVMAIGGDPYLVSSRGCYANCKFCSIKAFYKISNGPKYRFRSAENVVNELEDIYNEYGCKSFRIFDDNLFSGNNDGENRAIKIANEIIKRNLLINFEIVCRANDVNENTFSLLKRAGLSRVVIGLESFNQSVLNYYGKGIRVEDNYRAIHILDKLNIECVGSYIMFNPKSTFNEIWSDYYYYYSRLSIDKGINLINSILSTSTVLSIDEGTSLFNNEKVIDSKYISDNYQIDDIRVDKVKKAAIYITICIKNNILRLVYLDKYVKKIDNLSNNYEKEVNELNELWLELAKINLDILGRFINIYSKYDVVEKINKDNLFLIVEDLANFLEANWEKIDLFEKKYFVKKDVLPRTWFFCYKNNDDYLIYDIAKKEWQVEDELYVKILEQINYVKKPGDIMDRMKKSFLYEKLEKKYTKIISEIRTGKYIKPQKIFSRPSYLLIKKMFIMMVIN